jgi:UDP-N-acetylmuramoyl-tripeptide--D-alanyl-D-alanine ligase
MDTVKKIGKTFLCHLLEAQVKRLQQKNDFKVVAVAGSVGKTSTKLAIARTLSARERVIFQDGNYNDRLTVPLVLFSRTEPSIFSFFAWLNLLLANERVLRKDYPYDIAVLELGTDEPGQLERFAYLQPDLVVITAIAAEHMEFFKSLDAVAKEELTPLGFSKHALLNIDDIDAQYLPAVPFVSYGYQPQADYRLVEHRQQGLEGQALEISLDGGQKLTLQTHLLGAQGHKIILAAAAAAHILDWEPAAITEGLKRIAPTAGRMQILPGIKESQLIDDTYNASPIAVRAALDVLCSVEAPQRIAILGSMNELGTSSAEEHEQIGAYCDSKKLDLVVTIGAEAERHLAPAAKAAGCEVVSRKSPYEAGEYARQHLQAGAVVLAKGSQNGVFAEEALKLLLRNPDDANKLVRQSAYWLAVKRRQFPNA